MQHTIERLPMRFETVRAVALRESLPRRKPIVCYELGCDEPVYVVDHGRARCLEHFELAGRRAFRRLL